MPPKKEIWLDAQISPLLADFVSQLLPGINCVAMRDLGLRDSDDLAIFSKAKKHSSLVIIITKDADFVDLIIRLGSPPKIILLTCGNTSNAVLKKIFSLRLTDALALLNSADNEIVEISD